MSGNLHHLTWRQEQEMLENAFARRLLIEYGIKEVTTQRQAKNGTREFEFPVTCWTKQVIKWNKGVKPTKDKLRLAVFKSGYVRKQNGCYTPYQLNKTYKREHRDMFLYDGQLITRKGICLDRIKIYSQMARLKYMLEYYLRNYTI